MQNAGCSKILKIRLRIESWFGSNF